jgi:hypothetical protein
VCNCGGNQQGHAGARQTAGDGSLQYSLLLVACASSCCNYRAHNNELLSPDSCGSFVYTYLLTRKHSTPSLLLRDSSGDSVLR